MAAFFLNQDALRRPIGSAQGTAQGTGLEDRPRSWECT